MGTTSFRAIELVSGLVEGERAIRSSMNHAMTMIMPRRDHSQHANPALIKIWDGRKRGPRSLAAKILGPVASPGTSSAKRVKSLAPLQVRVESHEIEVLPTGVVVCYRFSCPQVGVG